MSQSAQKIIPHLWFDSQAEEAAHFYTSIFAGSKVGQITRYGKEGFEIHGQPEGQVMTVDYELAGYQFIALNGGPLFKFTPAISFFVLCETVEEIDTLWQKLLDGGAMMMPLDKYPWSERYGWLKDRYGLTWQLYLGKLSDIGQKIAPSLMYTGGHEGEAEGAIKLYTEAFPNSTINGIKRNGAGQQDPEGSVQHAQFRLAGETFMAMDSFYQHGFTFNEAISLLIACDSQDEIDHFWDILSKGGDPNAQQCGWLKDRFGVSWQVAPIVLRRMLKDADPERIARVTHAFLRMKKIDLPALERIYAEG